MSDLDRYAANRIKWRHALVSSACRFPLAAFFVGVFCTLQNLGQHFIITPLNRLIELSICRAYYFEYDPSIIRPDGEVPEHLCKEKRIQTQLASLVGLISLIGLINEIIVTIPLGYVSDKLGRKTVLFMNAIGCTLAFAWIMLVGYAYETFSIQAVIAAPFFYLIGGNVNVFNANALAIIADISGDITERTKMLGYFHAIGHGMRLLSPALSSFTMAKNLWIPFWIGLACFGMSIPFIVSLPYTSGSQKVERAQCVASAVPDVEWNREDSVVRSAAYLDPTEVDSYNDEPSEDTPLVQTAVQFSLATNVKESLRCFRREFQQLSRLILADRSIAPIFAVFLVTTLAKCVLNIIAQYVSYRYSWTFAQAGYLFTVKAGLNVFLFTILIPCLLPVVTERFSASKESANIYGAKGSIMLLGLGVLFMGVSPRIWMFIISLGIYALGSGLGLFMLSLLTTKTFKHLDEQHTAQLYSAVVLVETVGEVVGIPTLSSTMIAGISIGGYGVGLPFYVCAGLYFTASFAIWKLRPG